MSPIVLWTICYVLPTLAIVRLKVNEPNVVKRMLYIHVPLALTVGMFALFGIFFSWTITIYSLTACILSGVLVIALLGKLGALYIPSCIIQEWAVLIAGTALATVLPFHYAVILTAIPFALAHKDNKKTWKDWSIMFIPYLLWAVATLYLYHWLQQPLYNVALHLLAGAVLVHFGILFRNRHEIPWLMPH